MRDSGSESDAPNRLIAVLTIVSSAVGGGVAIAAMAVLSSQVDYPLMIVPFATSIVLVMGSPDVAPAKPRALIGGHLLASVIGLLIGYVAGPSIWAAAIAVGLSIAAMLATRTFHPPAGINPLIIVIYQLPWTFLIAPVAIGLLLLAVFASAWNTFLRPGGRQRAASAAFAAVSRLRVRAGSRRRDAARRP